ncbi:hypothetical protein DFJ77DRAFT_2733 [Powellomyces hirtus]|nr:hypothetical protein DFJ77DRAFT_2733 [Powellomyces hirtus]
MAASKEDYLQIVTAEETEIFIISLVEHVVQKSQEVLFEKHIESQVLPYAVQFAKGALDELVEWEFFRQDDGAIDPETWEPDEEPEPALTDSWSPGMIPFRKAVTAPATTSVPTPPILSTSTSGISVVSSEYQEEKQTPIGQRRPSTIGIRASANSLASTSKKYNTSRMELASAASLTTSSASLRQKRFSSVGSAGRRAGAGKDNSAPVPLSAVQIAEQAIQEENKRTLARLRSQEKESSKPIEWSYDHNGRVVVVKKTAIAKQITQGYAKLAP